MSQFGPLGQQEVGVRWRQLCHVSRYSLHGEHGQPAMPHQAWLQPAQLPWPSLQNSKPTKRNKHPRWDLTLVVGTWEMAFAGTKARPVVSVSERQWRGDRLAGWNPDSHCLQSG